MGITVEEVGGSTIVVVTQDAPSIVDVVTPGEQGPQGEKGDAATVDVGTITTGAPGTDASVVNSGTTAAAILDFTIPRGDKGETGERGLTGLKGDAGSAATIAVGTVTTGAAGSNASVTNSGTTSSAVFDFEIPRGATGSQGDRGPAGADGATGPKGDAGTAATIAVGTVTTGSAGSSASVTNSGSSSAATLNFTIPRGDKGETGSTGSTGAAGAAATVAVGTVTTGSAGSNASVSNSGTANAAVLDFTIPRGNTGATGATGSPGAAATIAVGSVTTGAAGSSAAVTNSGSSSAATFNFTIPRGDTGAIGPAGTKASVYAGTAAPGSPTAGDLWFDTTYGSMKVYYDDGNTSQWVDVYSAAGVSAAKPYAEKTGAYTTTALDHTINCISGTWTLNLVAAATIGVNGEHCIKNSGSGNITLDANGSETIDGDLTLVLGPKDSVFLRSTGTGWIIT